MHWGRCHRRGRTGRIGRGGATSNAGVCCLSPTPSPWPGHGPRHRRAVLLQRALQVAEEVQHKGEAREGAQQGGAPPLPWGGEGGEGGRPRCKAFGGPPGAVSGWLAAGASVSLRVFRESSADPFLPPTPSPPQLRPPPRSLQKNRAIGRRSLKFPAVRAETHNPLPESPPGVPPGFPVPDQPTLGVSLLR